MGDIAQNEGLKEKSHPGDDHEVPSYEPHASSTSLKERIRHHYELASDYYYSLWGQHIHHGLFRSPTETKEEAQVNLIKYLLKISCLPESSCVLDVGCGLGGTSRYLATHHGCSVAGITVSGRQVQLAKKLTLAEDSSLEVPTTETECTNHTSDFLPCQAGKVRFLELDAESMLPFFTSSSQPPQAFNCVWISEALSHLPNKPLFFSSAYSLLHGPQSNSPTSSLLVIADWFRAAELTPQQIENDIKPIEDGMLLPQLHTMDEYIQMAEQAGFKLKEGGGPFDISKDVARTWDISWSLISSPSLWAFAISQGRDGLAFLQAFRAMRRGYANGSFKYGVMCFEKS